jgi:KDO2-lipid IV(A) lauroyltransferase
VLGIYKPLANKTVEAYLNARREDFGMQLVGPKETRASLQKSTVEPCIFVLFGDQNPHNLNTCHWVPFLNRDTAWLQGVAEISHQQDFQVFYLKTKRVKRGFYVSVILPLELQPKIADPLEISATYARRVEADVLEQPEDWLWSHKRWKHKR